MLKVQGCLAQPFTWSKKLQHSRVFSKPVNKKNQLGKRAFKKRILQKVLSKGLLDQLVDRLVCKSLFLEKACEKQSLRAFVFLQAKKPWKKESSDEEAGGSSPPESKAAFERLERTRSIQRYCNIALERRSTCTIFDSAVMHCKLFCNGKGDEEMSEMQHNVIMALVSLVIVAFIAMMASKVEINYAIMTSLSFIIGSWLIAKAIVMKK